MVDVVVVDDEDGRSSMICDSGDVDGSELVEEGDLIGA
jgi:hypothetical protein